MIKPATNGTVSYTPHIEMAFKATDNETGIAKVKVAFLDTGGNELDSFYACGGASGRAGAC